MRPVEDIFFDKIKKLLTDKSVLPIAHKPFRHVGNSEQVGGNPGKPFRPL